MQSFLIFAVFQAKNEFRDFEGQEMRFKYDCVVAFLVFFVYFFKAGRFFLSFVPFACDFSKLLLRKKLRKNLRE